MKKIIAIVLALAFVLSLAACGESQTTATSISVCLASEPDTIDPALNSAVDGATLLAHLFSGLAKWSQDENGKLQIVADAAKELVIAGNADRNGDDLAKALARYDLAVTNHTSLTRFIVGRTISNQSNAKSLNIVNVETAAVPATVAVVSLVSMTAVGGFFFLKKKPF